LQEHVTWQNGADAPVGERCRKCIERAGNLVAQQIRQLADCKFLDDNTFRETEESFFVIYYPHAIFAVRDNEEDPDYSVRRGEAVWGGINSYTGQIERMN